MTRCTHIVLAVTVPIGLHLPTPQNLMHTD